MKDNVEILRDTKYATDYYPFGMGMPNRSWSAGEYRFGFNGQEKNDEISGSGNNYSFNYRVYDTRLGRFLSVDPLFATFPWNSTYAFAENRVIDGVDLEGLEYKSAGKWANENLTGWLTDWGNPNTYNRTYWSFSKHRDANYQAKVKKTDALQCIESVHFAYANGNANVYNYLASTGYYSKDISGGHSRKATYDYFKTGGEYHSFIEANDATKADIGDVVFYQNNSSTNKWTQNGGHATILGSQPTLTNDGKLVLSEYSINADGNKYGEREVVFIKNEANNWVKENNPDYQLQGFGRVDEEGINKKAEVKKNE